MDKGTLIFAIGFTIMVSMYILNMTRIDSGTSQNSDGYTEKTEARQIARTGVQLAINKLRSSSSLLGVVIQNLPLLGGTLDTVMIDSVPGQPDQRKVTSKGSYFGQKHRVVGIVQVPPTGLFNQNYLITQSLMEMQGSGITISSSSKKFFLNGHDWTPIPGSEDTDHFGIGANASLAPAVQVALINAGARDSVVGKGIYPSVTPGLSSSMNMPEQKQEVQRCATITYTQNKITQRTTWGSLNSPAIVYVTGSLMVNKPLRGAGILCIARDLTVRDSLNWQGYVMVNGNIFDAQSQGQEGKVFIQGSIFFGGGGALQFKSANSGNCYIKAQYSLYVMNLIKLRPPFASAIPIRPVLARIFE